MNGKHWLALGMTFAAGCGGGDATTPGDGGAATPAKGATPPAVAETALVQGKTPETVVTTVDFLKDPLQYTARVGVTGVVGKLDAANQRFALWPVAEAGCIGGG